MKFLKFLFFVVAVWGWHCSENVRAHFVMQFTDAAGTPSRSIRRLKWGKLSISTFI